MSRLFKIGYGYDSHRFLTEEEKKMVSAKGPYHTDTEYYATEKKLVIGGVVLEEKYQEAFGPLKARSDGDVLYHAVVNALLSALGNKSHRDIGKVFPNNDPDNSNRASGHFMEKSAELIAASDYELIDLKVMFKGLPRVNWELVERNLHSFFLSQQQPPEIHIQGTSGEEMDAAGNGEGVEVFAVCFLQLRNLFAETIGTKGT